jgi:ABC-type bacteriocin/lantibiotic exporter with double-glycine peptidase domain
MKRNRRYPLNRIDHRFRSNRYGSDFLTGCGSLVFIAFLIFIVFPLLIFVLRISVFFATLIIIGIVAFFVIAFFGRLVEFIRSGRWR